MDPRLWPSCTLSQCKDSKRYIRRVNDLRMAVSLPTLIVVKPDFDLLMPSCSYRLSRYEFVPG